MSENLPNSIKSQIELPVMVSPMFLVSGPDLVIQACKSGIVGSFPLANARTLDDLEQWMSTIKEGIEEERAQHPDKRIAPWAVNIVVHRTNKRYEDDLQFVKKYEPPIVITSLGDPKPIVDVVHSYGGHVFTNVVNIFHAKKAAEKGVDGLILVCNGAGGHAGTFNPFAFIGAVKEFWDGMTVLAGGISSGRDIAAAKLLGADLAYMGTRFIAATESLANSEYQKLLIESTIEDVVYTNQISGIWANFLKQSIQKAGFDLDNLQEKRTFDFSQGSKSGPKPWKDIWSAGHGVGSIKKVQSVREIVAQLKAEYDTYQ